MGRSSKALRMRLEIIWAETTTPVAASPAQFPRRYIAKSLGGYGYGWGVYDRKLGQFLTDRQVSKLSIVDLRQTLTH